MVPMYSSVCSLLYFLFKYENLDLICLTKNFDKNFLVHENYERTCTI